MVVGNAILLYLLQRIIGDAVIGCGLLLVVGSCRLLFSLICLSSSVVLNVGLVALTGLPRRGRRPNAFRLLLSRADRIPARLAAFMARTQ